MIPDDFSPRRLCPFRVPSSARSDDAHTTVVVVRNNRPRWCRGTRRKPTRRASNAMKSGPIRAATRDADEARRVPTTGEADEVGGAFAMSEPQASTTWMKLASIKTEAMSTSHITAPVLMRRQVIPSKGSTSSRYPGHHVPLGRAYHHSAPSLKTDSWSEEGGKLASL